LVEENPLKIVSNGMEQCLEVKTNPWGFGGRYY